MDHNAGLRGPEPFALSLPLQSDSTAQDLYTTLPLNIYSREIRLLVIEAAPELSDPISCTLEKHGLDQGIEYFALSYVWGSTENPSIIQVNGINFKITRNQDFALRQIRHLEPGARFWIDAICINQADLAERTQQVEIMDQIYKSAIQTWACIGSAQAGCDKALASLCYPLNDLARMRNRPIVDSRSFEAGDLLENALTEEVCNALDDLSRSPYWTRTWIVQEISLAKDVILLYGSYGTHWSIIHVLFQNHSGYTIIPNVMSRYRGTEISPKAQCLKRFFSATLRVYDTVYQVSMATKQHEPKHPRDIIDILDNGRYLEATNPLDRVYAFYGIFRTLGYEEEEQWLPLVNYSKSISILYRDFVVAYMSRFQSLEMILLARPEQNRDLSTWVPDWRHCRPAEEETPLEGKLYKASGVMKFQMPQSGEGNILKCEGIVCDTISVFQRESQGAGWETWVLARASLVYPTGIPCLQAFFRTILADQQTTKTRLVGGDNNDLFQQAAIGWLIELGVSVLDPTAVQALFSPDVQTFNNLLLSYILLSDRINQPAKTFAFISGFRSWMQKCITFCQKALDGMPVPAPDHFGVIRPCKLTHILEQEPFQGIQSERRPDKDIMTKHKALFERALAGESFSEILEPLLGPTGAPQSLPWSKYVNPILDGEHRFSVLFHRSTLFAGARALFMTGKGYFGLGPQTIAKDDVICVLYGCQVPVVLRKDGENYRLVGECFVLGPMNGEAIEWVKEEKAQVTTFRIA
jgi:hypothetical protein